MPTRGGKSRGGGGGRGRGTPASGTSPIIVSNNSGRAGRLTKREETRKQQEQQRQQQELLQKKNQSEGEDETKGGVGRGKKQKEQAETPENIKDLKKWNMEGVEKDADDLDQFVEEAQRGLQDIFEKVAEQDNVDDGKHGGTKPMSTETTSEDDWKKKDMTLQDRMSEDDPDVGGVDDEAKEGGGDPPTDTPVSGEQPLKDKETDDEGGDKGIKTPAHESIGGGGDPPRRTKWSQDKDKTYVIPPRDPKRKKSPNLKSAVVKDSKYVQLVFKVASSQDIQAGFLNKLGDFLTDIQTVDPSAAIMRGTDPDSPLGKKPKITDPNVLRNHQDLQDLLEEWIGLDESEKPYLRQFAATIPPGKFRTFRVTVKLATTVAHAGRTLEKVALKLQKHTIEAAVKRLQVLHTKRSWVLMGVHNGAGEEGAEKVLRLVLERAGETMVTRFPFSYDWEKEGGPAPDFSLLVDWVPNAPYRVTEKNEKVTMWQRRQFVLEISPDDEEYFTKVGEYASGMGLFARYFGDHSWFERIPTGDDGAAALATLGEKIIRSGSVMMCTGTIGLPGIRNLDTEVELHFVNELDRKSVVRTAREVMCSVKENGIRLFQYIGLSSKGTTTGYYPNGTGCEKHKEVAKLWSSNFGGYLRYHLKKRGVTEESIDDLLKAALMRDAYHMAKESVLKGGKVLSKSQLRTQDQLDKVERSGWVDCKKGLTQAEIRALDDAKITASKDAEKTPTDADAFNFRDDESAATYGRDQPHKKRAEAAKDSSESISEKTLFPEEDSGVTEASNGKGKEGVTYPPVEEWEFDPLLGDEDEEGYLKRKKEGEAKGKDSDDSDDDMVAGEDTGSPDSATPSGGSDAGASMSSDHWRARDQENKRRIAELQAQIQSMASANANSMESEPSESQNINQGATPSTSAQSASNATDASMGQECGEELAPKGG